MDLRFAKGVRKVISVETNSDGTRTVTTLYRKAQPKKKGSLTPAEKVARAAASGIQTAGQEYVALHDKSNSQKSDGWLRDMPYNVYRATRKAATKLQLLPIPVPYAVMGDDGADDDDGDDE